MNLNNLKNIEKLDPDFIMAKSIELLPDQVRQVRDDAYLIKIPSDYKNINQIVVNGMGGSNLGAGMIKAVLAEQLKAPIILSQGYQTPAYVSPNTLYIISSYSGNTEEPLSTYKEVHKRKARILAITSQNKNNQLDKLRQENHIPGYTFLPTNNPSNQPRLGIGYMFFGTMVMLAKAGLVKINTEEINDIIAKLEINSRRLRPQTDNNPAKKIATEIFKKQPIYVAAEHLTGNLRVLRNQTCENSKNFASYLVLPDMNHFAMEGLDNPKTNSKDMIFVFIDSNLYHPRIIKRNELTKKVCKKNNIKTINIKLTGETKLTQTFELLQLGSWITYYLAMLNETNPNNIPHVDWFKKQLG